MTKEWWFKIPSAHRPTVEKDLKGQGYRFGTTFLDGENRRWFTCSFPDNSKTRLVAYLYLSQYDQIRP